MRLWLLVLSLITVCHPSFAIIGEIEKGEILSSSVAILKFEDKTTEIKLENYTSICSGTLIDERTVITAAHCIRDLGFLSLSEEKENLRVYFKRNGVERFLEIEFQGILSDFFFAPSVDIDMGYLKLKKPLNLKKFNIVPAKPIKLKEIRRVFERRGSVLTLFNGYGKTKLGVPEYHHPHAQSMLIKRPSLDKMKGAFTLKSGSSFYYGDSGGGLFVKVNGEWKLFAVASHVDLSAPVKFQNSKKYLPKEIVVSDLENHYSSYLLNLCWMSMEKEFAHSKMSDEECSAVEEWSFN